MGPATRDASPPLPMDPAQFVAWQAGRENAGAWRPCMRAAARRGHSRCLRGAHRRPQLVQLPPHLRHPAPARSILPASPWPPICLLCTPPTAMRRASLCGGAPSGTLPSNRRCWGCRSWRQRQRGFWSRTNKQVTLLHLPACVPACLSACLPACLPACLLFARLSVLPDKRVGKVGGDDQPWGGRGRQRSSSHPAAAGRAGAYARGPLSALCVLPCRLRPDAAFFRQAADRLAASTRTVRWCRQSPRLHTPLGPPPAAYAASKKPRQFCASALRRLVVDLRLEQPQLLESTVTGEGRASGWALHPSLAGRVFGRRRSCHHKLHRQVCLYPLRLQESAMFNFIERGWSGAECGVVVGWGGGCGGGGGGGGGGVVGGSRAGSRARLRSRHSVSVSASSSPRFSGVGACITIVEQALPEGLNLLCTGFLLVGGCAGGRLACWLAGKALNLCCAPHARRWVAGWRRATRRVAGWLGPAGATARAPTVCRQIRWPLVRTPAPPAPRRLLTPAPC